MKNPLFYAKILLFGEYGIIENSKGLTIPYNFYQGALKFEPSEMAADSNAHLRKYAQFLSEQFSDLFDTTSFLEDVENGMYFDSNIPQGYGVGSSGALVAAIYNKYAKNKIGIESDLTKEKIAELKEIIITESKVPATAPAIDITEEITSNQYTNGKIIVEKVDLKNGGFMLMNPETSQIIAKFQPSSKTNVFRVTVTENNYSTIGYISSNTISYEIADGEQVKEVIFKAK